MSTLPFVIDRGNGTTLIKQLVAGFRQAIELGVYRPGDILPSFREVARESGACLIVVREAFKRLSAEGLVLPRRGVGSVVLDSDRKFWRGHVVIASLEVRENHLLSALTGALRQTLMKAGYLVSFVPYGTTPGDVDFSHLESVLRGPVTLVVASSGSPRLDAVMSRHKVPFVAFNYSKRADMLVRLDCSDAVAAFVDHCRRAKVKSVVEVTVGSSLASAAAALRKAGVECTSWPIVRRSGYGIEDISKATLKAFYDRIRLKGRSWLPDVLYFNDNFASQSALLALVDSGIDIPGDVRLVTWSNAGEGPYWRKSLARIEIDPIEAGHKFARHVLAFLDGKRLDDPAFVSPKYIAGETFPHT